MVELQKVVPRHDDREWEEKLSKAGIQAEVSFKSCIALSPLPKVGLDAESILKLPLAIPAPRKIGTEEGKD